MKNQSALEVRSNREVAYRVHTNHLIITSLVFLTPYIVSLKPRGRPIDIIHWKEVILSLTVGARLRLIVMHALAMGDHS